MLLYVESAMFLLFVKFILVTFILLNKIIEKIKQAVKKNIYALMRSI